MNKNERTTMCILHSTLRDATTPYTERYLLITDGNKRIKTEQAYYKVLVDLEKSELDLKSRKTGTLVAKGETESLISKIYRKTIAVLIRESEF